MRMRVRVRMRVRMRVRAREDEEEAEAVRSGVPGGGRSPRACRPRGGGSAHRRAVVHQLVVDLHLSGLLGD